MKRVHATMAVIHTYNMQVYIDEILLFKINDDRTKVDCTSCIVFHPMNIYLYSKTYIISYRFY